MPTREIFPGDFPPIIFNIFTVNMQIVQTHAQFSNFAIVKTSTDYWNSINDL